MKKFFYLIIPFFFLLIPFHSNAQALPAIDEDIFSVIDGGSEHLLNLRGSEYGIWTIIPDGLLDTVEYYLGIDPALQPEDYHIRPLSVIEQENLNDNFIRHFYDVNGDEVDIGSLYYVSADNGFFTAEFYIDSNGNVLYSDPEHSNTLLNIGMSSAGFSSVTGIVARDWDDVISHLSTEIKQNNFNFSPSGYDLSNYSFLVFAGTTSHGHPSSASYCYISNQYNVGVTVPVTSSGYINQWYTNYPDTIIYKEVYGSSGWLSVTRGEYYRDNVKYDYRVIFAQGMDFSHSSVNNNFEDWVNGSNPYQAIFGLYGQNYNQYSYEHSYSFYSVDGSNMPDINDNELYDYNELQLLQPDLDQSLNPDFDPSAAPVGGNVPTQVIDPFGNQQLDTSTLPLPGSNPALNPQPGFSPDPVVDITSETPVSGYIPIIEGLKNRFPFSIPWDIMRVLNGLSENPLPPAWDFDYSITTWGHTYTMHFSGDLSEYNSLAYIFRKLILISFLLFLALFSYKHFF